MDIILSNTCGKPIYEQIRDQVKEQIMAGDLAAGEALPSMRLLARELLREAQLRKVEGLLSAAADEARKGALTLSELHEMLDIMYQGDTP